MKRISVFATQMQIPLGDAGWRRREKKGGEREEVNNLMMDRRMAACSRAVE